MALNPNTTSGLSSHIMSFLEKRFIEHVKKEMFLYDLGMKKVLPKHTGKTVKWHQWTAISASTTSLTEATSPDGSSLASTAYTATVAGYGQFVTVSDYLQLSAINDTMKDATDLLAYAGALSIDTLIRNELDANGTQRYADPVNNSSKANVESGADQIASSDLKLALKALRNGNVPTFSDGLYRGIIHPFMEFSLLSEADANEFIILAAHNGSGKNVIEKGEIGTAFGIKLLRSTNVRADATSTNTYGNIIVGRDAFGVVDLESAQMKMIVKPHGSAGTEDPLDQRATVGYKFYFAVKILETTRTQVIWAYGS